MIIKLACFESSQCLLWSSATWKSQMLVPPFWESHEGTSITDGSGWQFASEGGHTCSLHDRLQLTKSLAQPPGAVWPGLPTCNAALPNRNDWRSVIQPGKFECTSSWYVDRKIGAWHVLWMMGLNYTGRDDENGRTSTCQDFIDWQATLLGDGPGVATEVAGEFVQLLTCRFNLLLFPFKLLWLVFWYPTYALDEFHLGLLKSLECLGDFPVIFKSWFPKR